MEADPKTELLKAIEGRAAAKAGITNLAAAYVRARAKIQHVVKNKTNPAFGSDYADLSAVLDAIQEPFADEGLALLQVPGDIEGDKVNLHWILMHSSGETLSGRSQIHIGPKQTPQHEGGALTYLRRYQGAAIGGLAQVDDDANEVSEAAPRGRKNNPAANAGAAALLSEIEAMTPETQPGVKVKVKALGDPKVAEAFLAKNRTLQKAAA